MVYIRAIVQFELQSPHAAISSCSRPPAAYTRVLLAEAGRPSLTWPTCMKLLRAAGVVTVGTPTLLMTECGALLEVWMIFALCSGLVLACCGWLSKAYGSCL